MWSPPTGAPLTRLPQAHLSRTRLRSATLLLAFNRGFTRGYLFGDRKGNLMGRDRPDNRGLLIGTVSRYDRRKGTATLCPDLPVTLHPGDGLLFSHPGPSGSGMGLFPQQLNLIVKRREIVLVVPHPVEKGRGSA